MKNNVAYADCKSSVNSNSILLAIQLMLLVERQTSTNSRSLFVSSPCVLDLARRGLIFTTIQEGTQPGGLTQPDHTEQGIPYHVPSCWVLVGGS